jgi:2,3-dihydroxybiphenyl 1,2-dioxygenase
MNASAPAISMNAPAPSISMKRTGPAMSMKEADPAIFANPTATAVPMRLGYLVFGVRNPGRWDAFAGSTLGLPRATARPDGSRGYRIDSLAQRLVVEPGASDDLLAIGIDCGSDAGVESVAQRLEDAGYEAREAPAALRRARGVRCLALARDPDGNAVELHAGAQRADEPFEAPCVPGGFRTGELGMGHAALAVRRLAEAERFYVEGLGFGVSERLATRAGPIDVRGAFLHCNRRHHSLAIFGLPSRKRLHHFMLETNSFADVGLAFDRARRNRVPLSLGLGQHPDPDGTFSFYARTPSGFDFEIGSGGREIDPRGWTEVRAERTSAWGHQPSLGLRLRMAGALIGARFARA